MTLSWREGLLALADGSLFEGEVLAFGPRSGEPRSGEPRSGEPRIRRTQIGEPRSGEPRSGEPRSGEPGDVGEPAFPAVGELVFNTVMTGYQEVLTDPSYAGQMIAFTYPHIGNYGVAPEDDESRQPFCRGVIVRELTGRPSNWRAAGSLAGFLERHRLQAMAAIDTRRLTRQLARRRRDAGRVRPGRRGAWFARRGCFALGSQGGTADGRP